MVINKIIQLINRYRIWRYRKALTELEHQIIIFEIPYDLAISKIEWYERRIDELTTTKN